MPRCDGNGIALLVNFLPVLGKNDDTFASLNESMEELSSSSSNIDRPPACFFGFTTGRFLDTTFSSPSSSSSSSSSTLSSSSTKEASPSSSSSSESSMKESSISSSSSSSSTIKSSTESRVSKEVCFFLLTPNRCFGDFCVDALFAFAVDDVRCCFRRCNAIFRSRSICASSRPRFFTVNHPGASDIISMQI